MTTILLPSEETMESQAVMSRFMAVMSWQTGIMKIAVKPEPVSAAVRTEAAARSSFMAAQWRPVVPTTVRVSDPAMRIEKE